MHPASSGELKESKLSLPQAHNSEFFWVGSWPAKPSFVGVPGPRDCTNQELGHLAPKVVACAELCSIALGPGHGAGSPQIGD